MEGVAPKTEVFVGSGGLVDTGNVAELLSGIKVEFAGVGETCGVLCIEPTDTVELPDGVDADPAPDTELRVSPAGVAELVELVNG